MLTELVRESFSGWRYLGSVDLPRQRCRRLFLCWKGTSPACQAATFGSVWLVIRTDTHQDVITRLRATARYQVSQEKARDLEPLALPHFIPSCADPLHLYTNKLLNSYFQALRSVKKLLCCSNHWL